MRKIIVLFIVSIIAMSDVFAYALKVYDEYGNRVGTYRKEGDKYQLYDFNDKKVENPDELIQNAPSQKTLTEYSQTFYDENMMPIGTFRSGFYGNDGRYYPRGGEFIPAAWTKMRTPYIVRPNANNNYAEYPNYQEKVNYIDTRFPRFHKFNQ